MTTPEGGKSLGRRLFEDKRKSPAAKTYSARSVPQPARPAEVLPNNWRSAVLLQLPLLLRLRLRYLSRAPPNGQVCHKAFFLGGSGRRAVAHTRPAFPKMPRAFSLFRALQAPGD